jgi:hypothetical protein
MHEIMQYLKAHGERLDSEIAAGTGMSLANVSRTLSELSAKGEVMMCRLTRFDNGRKIEGMLCRVSGYVPPAAPGRKAKART